MKVLRQVRNVKQTAIDTVNDNIQELNNELGDVAGQMPELEDNLPEEELDGRKTSEPGNSQSGQPQEFEQQKNQGIPAEPRP